MQSDQNPFSPSHEAQSSHGNEEHTYETKQIAVGLTDHMRSPSTAEQNQSFNTAMYAQLTNEPPASRRGKYVTGVLALLAAITGGLWMFTGNDDVQVVETANVEEVKADDIAALAPILPSNVTAHFGFDSSALDASTRAQLTELAGGLKADIDVKVELAGHADERGSEQYNMKLGQRRADAAKAFLVEQGVQAERLKAVSYGESRPVSHGKDEASYAKNRRVEVTVGSQLISQR